MDINLGAVAEDEVFSIQHWALRRRHLRTGIGLDRHLTRTKRKESQLHVGPSTLEDLKDYGRFYI